MRSTAVHRKFAMSSATLRRTSVPRCGLLRKGQIAAPLLSAAKASTRTALAGDMTPLESQRYGEQKNTPSSKRLAQRKTGQVGGCFFLKSDASRAETPKVHRSPPQERRGSMRDRPRHHVLAAGLEIEGQQPRQGTSPASPPQHRPIQAAPQPPESGTSQITPTRNHAADPLRSLTHDKPQPSKETRHGRTQSLRRGRAVPR